MNAIFQEDWEASVLTDKAIEARFNYLKPAVEKLNTKVEFPTEEIGWSRTQETVWTHQPRTFGT